MPDARSFPLAQPEALALGELIVDKIQRLHSPNNGLHANRERWRMQGAPRSKGGAN